MNDLISRQAAVDAIERNACNTQRAIDAVIGLPSVQPEKRTEKRTETHACDLIDREAAVDAIYHHLPSVSRTRARTMLHEVPSAQPEQDIEFIKLTVRNSNGRPYYSIIYLEVDDNGVGRDFEGYSSYSLDVISDYLKKYFMPSAHPERKTGKWIEEPNCYYRCSECGEHYPSILGYMNYNFCPHCGADMRGWKGERNEN